MAELPVIKRLRKEAEQINRELTIDLPKELERARAHGDLSENAEWAMAKQRQEFLRARLGNMEARIAELAMINLDSIPRDTVGLGSKVELEDLDEGGKVEYEIVVPEEVERIAASDLALVAARAGPDRQGAGRRHRGAHAQGQALVHGHTADHDSRANLAGKRQGEVKAGFLWPCSPASPASLIP